ncbi:hypothetical protein [Bacillus sp. AFS053548]|uniref:hypothetical protein n=1 Tax=Bacillus sp. AFS053548 TaxID=2033505 RepID=UPI000BFE93E1|nr:hypothetical protein [Bacillus sp. AFS053548]PGM53851.1 hypothetical protein CN946_16675 [Bacillus sp. AFS053548]
MKKRIFFMLVLISLICSLIGCSIKKPPQKIELNANGLYTTSYIRLSGNTNLPKNSVLELQINEIGKNDLTYNEKIKVEEKGYFSWLDTELDTSKDYTINLLFDPSKQSSEIQKKYGEKGEYIKDGEYSGLIKSKKGVQIVKISGTIVKTGGNKKGGIFNLQSPK